MHYLCNLLSFAELFLPGDGHLLDQLLGLFQSIFQLWSLQRLKKKTQQAKLHEYRISQILISNILMMSHLCLGQLYP